MPDAEHPESQDHWEQTAEEIEAAVQVAKEEAAKVEAEARRHLPETAGLMTQIAYKTSYAISYGLVFPSALIAQSVPKNNVLVHGLIDGAQAARDKAAALKGGHSSVSV